MPSKRNNAPSRRVAAASHSGQSHHVAFVPLLVLVFLVWVVYRVLFRFPVWFDETIGKAVFFGLPVWLYISLSRSKAITNTYAPAQLQPGLLVGIAVGGLFGFAGTFASLLTRQVFVQAAPLFLSNSFWWEFFLAMMTGFWESLFFYCWIMTVVGEKWRGWTLVNQVMCVALIFLAFHLPNMFLRFPLGAIPTQVVLLFFFGIGQAFLFARYRNLYSLILSQAIWGMVLLIHTQ